MQAKLPSQYSTLYIVRHAQSQSNASGYLAGQKDEQLTELGEQQALARAKDLSTLQFDAFFSSDLLRAKHTAEIIAREHKLAIETTKCLRERMWGEKQEYAKTAEEKKEINRLRAEYDKIPPIERYSLKVFEGMESDEEVISRLIAFLREIAVAYLGKNVLIVTHGNILKVFLVHLGFAKDYQELPSGSIVNTGYIKLRCDGVAFFIVETKGVYKVLH